MTDTLKRSDGFLARWRASPVPTKWLMALGLTVSILAPAIGWCGKPPSASLCEPDERVFFDCEIAGKKGPKRVSVCGSQNPAGKGGYLQYRFGRAGALELEYPPGRGDPGGAFRYSHYARFQVSRTAVGFTREGAAYWVFDDYEGDAPPATRVQGVQVTLRGAKEKSLTLSCVGVATSELGSLETVLPCANDDPLNLGECP